jgi:hypothetical protein
MSRIADEADRVVVTKDSDFRFGHLLVGSPRKLLVVATGNITNDSLAASTPCVRSTGRGTGHVRLVKLVLPLAWWWVSQPASWAR